MTAAARRWSSSTSRTASAPTTRFADVAAAAGRLVEGAQHPRRPDHRHRAVPQGPAAHRGRGRAADGDATLVEKSVFCAVRADGFNLAGRNQVLLCGIEAHVCVTQTALDLLDRGVAVQVVTDAVGSRHAHDREVGAAAPRPRRRRS